mgnify:CR=1 FL=1
MSTSNGLPTLTITFQKAAQTVANRSKKGFVGVFVRDSEAQGVHQITSVALIPSALSVDNQAYLQRAFEGSSRGGPSKVVAIVIAPGTENTTALEAGLALLAGQTLDYLAPPPDLTEAEEQVLVDWVKERRSNYFTEKLVLANAVTPPDEKGIINFVETELDTAKDSFTAGEYTSRIAGILAGLPQSMSGTYAQLPELTAVTTRTKQEQIEAINAGKLILMHDGQVAKIARAVNSLTTIPTGGKEDWSKIKIVEGMDLITYYLRTTIQNEYLGQYANTYDNKCLLVTAISEYLTYLEGSGVLNPGESYAEIDTVAQEKWLKANGVETADMTQQQIKEYQTGAWVFIKCGGRLLDAMEDFQVEFNNL